jgi:glycosyltransferase involved in cell wall biosynthesis
VIYFIASFVHITFWGWVIYFLAQIFFTGIWLKSMRPHPAQQKLPDFHPKTLVLLTIRGADPRLAQCLHGILDQDYPNYELGIIVDSREDPAWELVHKVLDTIKSGPRVQVSPLKNRLETAGLKNSSLLQALEELDPSFEAIAMLDSDLVPPRYWLKELISPLADPRVGATTGLQWYLPVGSKLGTWVRYILGILSMVIMAVFRIPWGGTFAFRTRILRETSVLDWLRHSLPDTPIFHRGLRHLGLELQLVPNLLMTHNEECSFKAATQWYARSLLWIRYYNNTWKGVAAAALLPALFLTLLAHSFALAWASFTKKVAWRGIVYSIEGPYQVRKLSESNLRLGELQSASE